MRFRAAGPSIPTILALICLQAPARVAADAGQGVIPGLEVLLAEQKSLIEGKRVGLITNHTGVDRRLRHGIDLLNALPGVKLSALFAPEHGVRGDIQAGGLVADTVDEILASWQPELRKFEVLRRKYLLYP